MKPDQNKSLRSRPAGGRREPNPLTRIHESQGPDVRIRGTARHVADKYLQLARDAHTGGNPVQAENYLQHAEHYFRLIAAAEAGAPRDGRNRSGRSGNGVRRRRIARSFRAPRRTGAASLRRAKGSLAPKSGLTGQKH